MHIRHPIIQPLNLEKNSLTPALGFRLAASHLSKGVFLNKEPSREFKNSQIVSKK